MFGIGMDPVEDLLRVDAHRNFLGALKMLCTLEENKGNVLA